MDQGAIDRREDLRQVEHFAPIGFALLLPYISFTAAVALACLAVLHALFFSPRLFRVTTRPGERLRGFSPGKLYYALGILALLLIFHQRLYIVAGVWGILAAGDSFSNVLGRRFGRWQLPFNRKKSLQGLVTFIVAGTVAGWILMWWNWPDHESAPALTLFVFALITATLCGLAEALPEVIDDNLLVCWVGAFTLALLFEVPSTAPALRGNLTAALSVNLAIALTTHIVKWLSGAGTLLAFGFGVLVYLSFGLGGYLVILAFLVLSSLATRAGLKRKKRLGVAQADEGRRGVFNVVSNGAVAVLIAGFGLWVPHPVLAVGFCGAVATASFDTISTEIGQWLGRHPFDPMTLKQVPVGTRGAISLEGTAAGLMAALACWTVGWLTALVFLESCIPVVGGAAVAGLLESILGSRVESTSEYFDGALNIINTLMGACGAAILWLLV